MDTNYQYDLGERLRRIRQQQGLTLQQVEKKSQGRWKAVVVGSYERGDRAVSVAKLAELADFYGVPVTELLPHSEVGGSGATPVNRSDGEGRVVVDLTRLRRDESDPEVEPVSRYVTSIQVQRGDYNGRMLTLRGDDVRALASVLGRDPEEFLVDMSDRGLIVAS